MKRTTLRLDEHLLQQAKQIAIAEGKTLTAVIEEALRATVARHHAPPAHPVRLPVFTGEGLRPGVDLDDSASLLDLMDAAD